MESKKNSHLCSRGFSLNSRYVCIILFLALQMCICSTLNTEDESILRSQGNTTLPVLSTTNNPPQRRLICTKSDSGNYGRPECKNLINRITRGRSRRKTYEEIAEFLANLQKFDENRNSIDSVNDEVKEDDVGRKDQGTEGPIMTREEIFQEKSSNLPKFNYRSIWNSRNGESRDGGNENKSSRDDRVRMNLANYPNDPFTRSMMEYSQRQLERDLEAQVNQRREKEKREEADRSKPNFKGIGVVIFVLFVLGLVIRCAVAYCAKHDAEALTVRRNTHPVHIAVLPRPGRISPRPPYPLPSSLSGSFPMHPSTELIARRENLTPSDPSAPVLNNPTSNAHVHVPVRTQSTDSDLPTYDECVPTAPPIDEESDQELPSSFLRKIPGPR